MGLKPGKSGEAASSGSAAHPTKATAPHVPPPKAAELPPFRKTGEPPRPAHKWRRRKDARPQEILTAALMVFAERGFNAARMEDIAARAGVSKGTLYLYFDSKQEMLRAMVREGLAANLQSAGGMLAQYDGPSAGLLRLFLGMAVHAVLLSPLAAVPKIIISESGNFPEIAEFYRREVIDVGLGLIARIIERGVARGEFGPLDAHGTAMLFMAPVLMTAIWKSCFAQFDKDPFDPTAIMAQHLDIFLAGISAPENRSGA
jgi:AcrR family transcriptional regulator